MLGVDEPPHHLLQMAGRVDDADEQVPFMRIRSIEDDLGAIIEGVVEIQGHRGHRESPPAASADGRRASPAPIALPLLCAFSESLSLCVSCGRLLWIGIP
jgi:hypothetical protein